MSEEQSDNTIVIAAQTKRERSEYFQPFPFETSDGRKYTACGCARRACSQCGRRFSKDDFLLLRCPDCSFDRRCTAIPMKGYRRCRVHNRKSKRGALANTYKHGRRAGLPVQFPPDVQRAYINALKVCNARNVFGEMALFMVRIDELSKKLASTQESQQWWTKAAKAEKRARDAAASGDEKALKRSVNELMGIVRRGSSEQQQWRELLQLTRDLASLKQVQSGIEKDHKAYLSMNDAMSIITTMANSVREALLLVRDHWKSIERMLGENEFDELLQRVAASIESDGSWENELREWHEQVPAREMSTSFGNADNLIQRRLTEMLPESTVS